MFSGAFCKNKFSNNEKMRKIMKESMDKYNRGLDEKYKIPLKINTDIKIENANVSIISLFPFIIFGLGVYQFYKGVFIKR